MLYFRLLLKLLGPHWYMESNLVTVHYLYQYNIDTDLVHQMAVGHKLHPGVAQYLRLL